MDSRASAQLGQGTLIEGYFTPTTVSHDRLETAQQGVRLRWHDGRLRYDRAPNRTSGGPMP